VGFLFLSQPVNLLLAFAEAGNLGNGFKKPEYY
jgi:hypothetical protein